MITSRVPNSTNTTSLLSLLYVNMHLAPSQPLKIPSKKPKKIIYASKKKIPHPSKNRCKQIKRSQEKLKNETIIKEIYKPANLNHLADIYHSLSKQSKQSFSTPFFDEKNQPLPAFKQLINTPTVLKKIITIQDIVNNTVNGTVIFKIGDFSVKVSTKKDKNGHSAADLIVYCNLADDIGKIIAPRTIKFSEGNNATYAVKQTFDLKVAEQACHHNRLYFPLCEQADFYTQSPGKSEISSPHMHIYDAGSDCTDNDSLLYDVIGISAISVAALAVIALLFYKCYRPPEAAELSFTREEEELELHKYSSMDTPENSVSLVDEDEEIASQDNISISRTDNSSRCPRWTKWLCSFFSKSNVDNQSLMTSEAESSSLYSP